MLLIYLPTVTPRSEYIFELIFRQHFGINYHTTSDTIAFEKHAEEKINYSDQRLHEEFFIKPSNLLSDDSVKIFDIPVSEKHQTKILFPNDECDLGFDIFSAIFYMVSRYEEYLPFIPDEYGRFKASDSLACRNDFLQIPVVDIWINQLKSILEKRFPSLEIKTAFFNAMVTYDIDVAYKYKGRSFLRTAGASIKDILKLDFNNFSKRIQTLFNLKDDPWNVYDYLSETVGHHQLNAVFFFLLGDASQNDRNLNYKNPAMKRLVRKVSGFSEIGIHPSFLSSSNPEKFVIEKQRLEKISGKVITKSRQHFLKFKLPDTYLHLISAGIMEDYSMGYAEMAGFRAGACKPFYFYDLKNEATTPLRIFPVSCMEGSFLKTNLPAEALQKIVQLVDEVKKVNGTFISVWHNHTVSEDYTEWKKVHDKMVGKLMKEKALITTLGDA